MVVKGSSKALSDLVRLYESLSRVKKYELRYAIQETTIYIVRLWHTPKEVKIVYATKGAKLYEVFDGIPSRCS